jgi:hypothetical protein
MECYGEHLKRKQPKSIRKHKSGIPKETLESLKIRIHATSICPCKRKSPDRRQTMQASAVIQQCSKQITETEEAEGKERWWKFFSTEATMNR